MNNSSSSLKKNSLFNIIKYTSSVVFPLITFPYIARTLGVENVGKINFANSIITYFTLAASLGVATYATRECAKEISDRDKLSRIASQIYSINLISTLASYAGLIVLLLLPIPQIREVCNLLLIQSVTILFATLGADWINIAEGDFRYITVRTVGMQLFSLVMMFLFIHHPNDYVKYACISVLAASGANFINVFYRRRFCRIRFTRKMNGKIHLPRIMTFFSTVLCQTIYTSSDTTMLRIMKDNYQVGLYSTAVKIYNIINGAIASVTTVILPDLSRLYKENDKKRVSEEAQYALNFIAFLSIPVFAALNILGPRLIIMLAGEDYLGAVPALRILSIAMIFSQAGNFVGSVFIIPRGKEKIGLIAAIVSAATNVGLNLFFIPLWGLNGAAATTAISEFLGFIIGVPFITKDVKIHNIGKNLLSVLFATGVMSAGIIGLGHFLGNSIPVTLLLCVTGFLIYASVLVIMKNEFVLSFIRPVLRRLKRQ